MTDYWVDTASVRLAGRLCEAEQQAARLHGGFTLFGLFEPEDRCSRWDLVAAAPWLPLESSGIKELIDALKPFLGDEDWRALSRVSPMKEASDFVQAITRKYHSEHQVEEIGSTYVNGLCITHAFLITSNPSPAPALAQPVAA